MNAVIFAGGVGTRLWPLSRRNSPKQFEKVIGEKSTLQLAADRLIPTFSWEHIYVSTGSRYAHMVAEQLPHIPKENIIGEPETRDVGPAVALATSILYKRDPHTPVIILWSDHLVRHVELFQKILQTCEEIIKEEKDKILFISQKPRFASQNLGWIKFGKTSFSRDGVDFRHFESFHYRPQLEEATQFFKKGTHAWNLGYFVTTPAFLWKLYQEHQPDMFSVMEQMYAAVDTEKFSRVVAKVYPQLQKISFDNAILEKIHSSSAYVISEDLGWSDVGAWEALKEALQSSPEQNVTQGKVLLTDTRDSLVYNYTDQLVVGIDLSGFLVINTNDVVLVCHKNSVPKIKQLVEKMAHSENEHLV